MLSFPLQTPSTHMNISALLKHCNGKQWGAVKLAQGYAFTKIYVQTDIIKINKFLQHQDVIYIFHYIFPRSRYCPKPNVVNY